MKRVDDRKIYRICMNGALRLIQQFIGDLNKLMYFDICWRDNDGNKRIALKKTIKNRKGVILNACLKSAIDQIRVVESSVGNNGPVVGQLGRRKKMMKKNCK